MKKYLGLEREVAIFARKGPDICVCSNVLLQHRRLFAANPASVTNVFSPAPSPNVGVSVIRRLVPALDHPQGPCTFTFVLLPTNSTTGCG